MLIVRKDTENKEIEVPGFRKILNNPKNPSYKELKIYINKGWIPVDPDDDIKEKEKAKKKKRIAKENKARRPKYKAMEENIQKLGNKTMLEEFNNKKAIKNNYNNVLKWYNAEMQKLQQKAEGETPSKTKNESKSEAK